MRAVKKWRYYCDYCKKSGASSFHMKNHETHCTLNPDRECRMCTHINGGSGAPMAEMLALLPDPAKFKRVENCGLGPYNVMDDEGLSAAAHAALPALRELAEDCCVCIFAALRQRGIPLPIVTEFNFTAEMKSAQGMMNEARNEGVSYY